jgi:predicted DNA-binding transcriptional regulator AlpA
MPAPKAAPSAPSVGPIVMLSRDDLHSLLGQLLEDIVLTPQQELLDRAGLATALHVSLATVDGLRKRPGFPRIVIGPETVRFDWKEVLAWLKANPQMEGK